jgi:hypothetical protein
MEFASYDEWWDSVHEMRVKVEDFVKEWHKVKADAEVCIVTKKRCPSIRTKVINHVIYAKDLLLDVDNLITKGSELKERRENYEHLMWRLSQMKNDLLNVVSEAQGLLSLMMER